MITIYLSKPTERHSQIQVFGLFDDGDDRFVFGVRDFTPESLARAEFHARQLADIHKADRVVGLKGAVSRRILVMRPGGALTPMGMWDGAAVEWDDPDCLYYETRYLIETALASGLTADVITSGETGDQIPWKLEE